MEIFDQVPEVSEGSYFYEFPGGISSYTQSLSPHRFLKISCSKIAQIFLPVN